MAARRRTKYGDLRLLLLHLVSTAPMTGADLQQAIDEATGGRYRPSGGSIYPRLTSLKVKGLVRPTAPVGRRVEYQITDQGARALAAQEHEVRAAHERICGD